MGAGCSSSSPTNAGAKDAPGPRPAGPQPGYIYLSFHSADTGERADGGDGAATRICDWLVSRGYVVVMGEPDPDAAVLTGQGPGATAPAGVQSGLKQSWQARMLQQVKGCQALLALCSPNYGTRPEAAKEITAAESLSAATATVLPLWHSGPWPPEGPLQTRLAPMQRVPRGPRPLVRSILDAVMGEAVDRLQQAGCMPAPAGAAAGAAGDGGGAAGGGGGAAAVAVGKSLDHYFQPGESDPTPEEYAFVRCYTGNLQELSDRLRLTVRPTIFDLGGDTFSGDLPILPSSAFGAAPAYAGMPDPSTPAGGGTLLFNRPHVTLRNGSLKLRADQEVRVTAHGVQWDTVSVIMELQQGPHGGVIAGGVAGRPVGPAYESGRAMVVMVGALGVRMTKCQLTNHGPHLAFWLAGGSTAAMRQCQIEAPAGGGVWVRDAGSEIAAQSSHLQRCSGPCLKLEAGARAVLESCSVVDSSEHNALLVSSGSTVRADRCVVSGAQVGVNLFAGASAELVGCEVTGNRLAGAEVSEPGSSLTAVETKFSSNGQSGVLVALGASASLTSCTATGNKAHGVLVRGEGTVGNLRQVMLSYNGQAGALVSDRARAELATCESTGNKVCGLIVWGAGTGVKVADTKVTQNAQAGLAVKDGGLAELARCWVKTNKLASEVSGAGSRLVSTVACVVDPKPNVLNGGVHDVLDAKGHKKK